MIFTSVACVFLVKIPIALVLRHWLLACVQICVNYIFCSIHHAVLPALLFLPASMDVPRELIRKVLTVFSLLSACFESSPSSITFFLQSVITCAGKIVLTIHKVWICFCFTMSCFMFCWMRSPAHPRAGYVRSDQNRVFQMSLAS